MTSGGGSGHDRWTAHGEELPCLTVFPQATSVRSISHLFKVLSGTSFVEQACLQRVAEHGRCLLRNFIPCKVHPMFQVNLYPKYYMLFPWRSIWELAIYSGYHRFKEGQHSRHGCSKPKSFHNSQHTPVLKWLPWCYMVWTTCVQQVALLLPSLQCSSLIIEAAHHIGWYLRYCSRRWPTY